MTIPSVACVDAVVVRRAVAKVALALMAPNVDPGALPTVYTARR